MRAAQLVEAHSGAAGVHLREVADPQPEDDEVLIAVGAVSVSKLEVEQLMAGRGMGSRLHLPRTMGIDPAGTVLASGRAVDRDLIGRRVVVKPNLVCGNCQNCRRQREAGCTDQQMLGVHRDGGHAEKVTVPARNVFPIGDSVDFVSASAAVHSIPVAHHMLNAIGVIEPDETVLVTGATGGVGGAAVQLLRDAKARVLAVVGSREGAIRAAELGADDIVVYDRTSDLTRTVRKMSPEGVRGVVDTTGDGSLVTAAIECLGWQGVAVTCAGQAGATLEVDLARLYANRRTFVGIAGSHFVDVVAGLDVLAQGRVRPIVDATYSLAEIQVAYATLIDRGSSGKVVLQLGREA